MNRRRWGRHAWLASVVLPLVVLAGCRTTPNASVPPQPGPVETATPGWVGQPLSWQKLEMIEQWLESDAADHDDQLVVEAELQLNEGRVEFTRRDLESGAVPKAALKVRAGNAKAGFEKVLTQPAASAGQRSRAQIGLRAASALLAAPGAVDVAIISRAQWGARAPRISNLTPLKGAWSRITVHHSAENSSDPKGGSFEDSAATLRAIQKFHMDDPGHRWGDIGYHFVIDSGGRIFEGRELKWQGAHAGGDHNIQNIGICLLGDLLQHAPSPAALKSLQVLLQRLRDQYHIPASRVYPHSEFANTRCPGPGLTAWLKNYR